MLKKGLFCLILMFVVLPLVNADVLVLTLNNNEFIEGESIIVSGYVLDDSLNGINGTAVQIFLNGSLNGTLVSASDGYYEHYIDGLSAGTYALNASTASKTQTLVFDVVAPELKPSYQVLADSLVVPFSSPVLSFTINKYLGSEITSQSYNYSVYYDNGTLYSTGSGISGIEENLTLPSQVSMFRIVVDEKKSFVVSVAKFTLKFRITDSKGGTKDTFKPNGIAYFEVEGYSNNQVIQNATVTATVTSPAGTAKTVTFTNRDGVFKGNTNSTQTSPIQLQGGDYSVEFIMKDSSNNEQKVKGFFTVLGLGVKVDLINKKPYKSGDDAEFKIYVKDLDSGTLIDNDDISYVVEAEKNGKKYMVSASPENSSDAAASSSLIYTVPSDIQDGGYNMIVRASYSGKTGKGSEFFEVMNKEVFVDLTDNYGTFRDDFKPGELAKLTLNTDFNFTDFTAKIYLDDDLVSNFTSAEAYKTFNVPAALGKYNIKITVNAADGTTVTRSRWFNVQNYFSYLEVKDQNDMFKFIHKPGDPFLAQIAVFDISTGEGVDLTDFIIKFNQIVDEKTQKIYTNFQATENTTLSDRSTGRLVYNFQPPELTDSIYRIEYTIVDSDGRSSDGLGWFGISAFDVAVSTYDENGQQKEIFAAGDSINISVEISEQINGTAILHREEEFYSQKSFNITDGKGYVMLSSANQELPSESGFYGFGVEVTSDAGSTGLGNGFFEIRNLNFRSIGVRSNGKFAPSDDIVADVVVEKSGSLLENANVSCDRIIRNRDGYEISDMVIVSALTDSIGRTVITIDPYADLEPGQYTAILSAEKDGEYSFSEFSFEITKDKVSVSVNDDDGIFRSTDNIEIDVTVTYSNNTPKSNVTVNLTALLDFDTWAQVSVSKSAVTQSNGIATITLSANNYQPGRYAPVLSVAGIENEIVGFDTGEFEIKPFTVDIDFATGEESYITSDSVIIFNITLTGTATVTAVVEDMSGNPVDIDYYYSDNQLVLNNDLVPDAYFITISVTQNGKTVEKKMWFDILAPMVHMEKLQQDSYLPSDSFDINYTVFTLSADGWQPSNATLTLATIENLWTGDKITVNETFTTQTDQDGFGVYAGFNLTPYNLTTGDYIINVNISENPYFADTLYFRIDKNIFIDVVTSVNSTTGTVNFTVTATGVSSPEYWLRFYNNFDTFEMTQADELQASSSFLLENLTNGFYQAQIEIRDTVTQESFFLDTFFDVRVRDVQIDVPENAMVGELMTFNITSSLFTDFWIIDTFSQTVLMNQQIAPGAMQLNYTFNYPGYFMVSFGEDKLEAFRNAYGIDVVQPGFHVDWEWDNNRYVLGGDRNFTFNVTDSVFGDDLVLVLKNHFNQQKYVENLGAATGAFQSFSLNLSEIASGTIELGPHDVELIMDNGMPNPPRELFFIDLYPDSFDMWAWADKPEYRAGENVSLRIEIYNLLNNWVKEDPDNVELTDLYDPFGSTVSAVLGWSSGDTAIIGTTGFMTGNYHAELNITEQGFSRIVPVDFFVRGDDGLEIFSQQEKWDFSLSDQVEIVITAKDNGVPASGIGAVLSGFEMMPEDWNSTPVDMSASVLGHFNFSPENKTGTDGKVTFSLDLSGIGLSYGQYSGRIIVGGQPVWFGFSVKSYMVDSYTDEWEYGMTDTIELNVRAREFDTWNPISESGNVTIKKIMQHEPGMWEPTVRSLSDFGITDPVVDVENGEALIEMQANQTSLILDKPYEFEVLLEMNLSGSGISSGTAWFRLSNTTKPSMEIQDTTGQEADKIYPDQRYVLAVSDAGSARLKNIFGPESRFYDELFIDSNGTLSLNFTTPRVPGYYTIEVEVVRLDGFTENIYTDFLIGSGTEMDIFSDGSSFMEDVNMTLYVHLFGKSTDPWCIANPEDEWCNNPDNVWFGPITNKSVMLKSIKNLNTFSTVDMTGSNISAMTNPWPDWALPDTWVDCSSNPDNSSCASEDSCVWAYDAIAAADRCMDYSQFCSQIVNETACSAESACTWMVDHCDHIDVPDDAPKDSPSVEDEPGLAIFNLNPAELGLSKGNRYDLIFSYTDEEGSEHTEKFYLLVESFHVSISKKESNLEPNSEQKVWLKTTDFAGEPLGNCSIEFSGIYDKKDYVLVKQLGTTNYTDANGSLVFTYAAPSLPGDYLIEGLATCEVSSGNFTAQDITYSVDVGSKDMKVEIRSRFEPDDNIRIVVETKDRLGTPIMQDFEMRLFHNIDGYDGTISPTSTVDCEELKASPMGSFMGADNALWTSTGDDGVREVELCPLPQGDYSIEIFPMFGMVDPMMIDKDMEEETGFSADFTVGYGDIDIATKSKYMVGETVNISLLVTDSEGNPVNGTLDYADAVLEVPEADEILIHINESVNLPVVDGVVHYSFVVPSNGTNEETNESAEIVTGPVDLFFKVTGNDGTKYIKYGIPFTIIRSSSSYVSAPAVIGTNELIPLEIETDNNGRYKVQKGIFFMKENPSKMKTWYIENGALFRNMTNQSEADIQILSPKEPGDYIIAIPVYDLQTPVKSVSQAYEFLVAPINVKLETINVTGRVVYSTDNSTPVEDALVQIGNAEVFTNTSGEFRFEVPKGRKNIFVEKKTGNTRFYMESNDMFDFSANVDQMNISLYRLPIDAVLDPSFVDINPNTSASAAIDVDIVLNNTLANAVGFNGSLLEVSALTKNSTSLDISTETKNITLTVRPENLTGDYSVFVMFSDDSWPGVSYINIDGTDLNNTVGCMLEEIYSVNSTFTGEFNGWCGDEICVADEVSWCDIDCGGVTGFCGDSIINGDEWCDAADLAGHTCQDFGFENGTLGCFGDCHGWDFSQCNWADGAPGPVAAPPELNITTYDAYSNETHMIFNITVLNLSGSPACGGSGLIDPDEFFVWRVSIDSVAGGCNLGWCSLQQDYLVSVETNQTGGTDVVYEVWNGTDFKEDLSDTDYVLDCPGDSIVITIPLQQLNISSCQTMDYQAESVFVDEGKLIYDVYPSNPDVYLISCTGGSNASLSGFRTLQNGSEIQGIIPGELCINTTGFDMCLPLNTSDYDVGDIPEGIYDISFSGGDGLNEIELFGFNISGHVEMNFTIHDGSDLIWDIIASNPLTRGNAENFRVNISNVGSINYTGYSLFFEIEQENISKYFDEIWSMNLTLYPGQDQSVDCGDYAIDPANFSLGKVSAMAILEGYDPVVMTNITGPVLAYQRIDYGEQFNVTEAAMPAFFLDLVITDPLDSATVTHDNVDFTYNISGDAGNISLYNRTEMYIIGTGLSDQRFDAISGEFINTFIGVPEGSFDFLVALIDDFGRNITKNISFTVDTPIDLNISFPFESEIITSDTYNFTYVLYGDLSEYATTIYWFDDDDAKFHNCTGGVPPWSCMMELDISGLANGTTHTINMQVHNSTGDSVSQFRTTSFDLNIGG